MPTSGRSSASSTKTAHTGSGAAQTRGAGTQYFSNPRPTLDCALRRQRILSRVCASNRWRENPGSATGRSLASGATPVKSSASREQPRSTSAAASEDLPAPPGPSSSAAPAPVWTDAVCKVNTQRCCSRTVKGARTKKPAKPPSPSPIGSMRMSRSRTTRHRARSSMCIASFSTSDRGRRRPAPSRHTEASGWTLRRWRQQASGETWDVFRMSSGKFFDEIVEFAACGLTDR